MRPSSTATSTSGRRTGRRPPAQHGGGAGHVAVRAARGDQRDVVRLAQVDAEQLGALHHRRHVGVTAEQVVVGQHRRVLAEQIDRSSAGGRR